MIDVLSYLGGIASRKQGADEFAAQQKFAKDQFAESVRRYGLDSALSNQQHAEKVREFNLGQDLASRELAQKVDEFRQTLADKQKSNMASAIASAIPGTVMGSAKRNDLLDQLLALYGLSFPSTQKTEGITRIW